jgi:hypothetical protein
MSEMFKLDVSDVFKGAITAIFAAMITALYGLVTQPDFSIFDANWAMIANDVIKVSFAAFMAYLLKNWGSTRTGDFAGIKV